MKCSSLDSDIISDHADLLIGDIRNLYLRLAFLVVSNVLGLCLYLSFLVRKRVFVRQKVLDRRRVLLEDVPK